MSEKPTHVKQARMDAVITDYRSGMHPRDVASKHGISRRTLYNYLEERNIPRPDKRPRRRTDFTDEEAEDIARRYLSDETLETLALQYRCGEGVIRRLLVSRGINIRPPGEFLPEPPQHTLIKLPVDIERRVRKLAKASNRRLSEQLAILVQKGLEAD